MANKIKAAFFDLDGTITDGMYHVSASGTLTKSFYTRDFYGLHALDQADIQVHILTHSDDDVIHHKIEHLSDYKFPIEIHHLTPEWVRTFFDDPFYPKSIDKGEYLTWWSKNNHFDLKEIAYMGDAEGDIPALEIAGMAACPHDAIDKVKWYEDVAIMSSPGGKGAVHDFCGFILEHNEFLDRTNK